MVFLLKNWLRDRIENVFRLSSIVKEKKEIVVGDLNDRLKRCTLDWQCDRELLPKWGRMRRRSDADNVAETGRTCVAVFPKNMEKWRRERKTLNLSVPISCWHASCKLLKQRCIHP
jgi:hypothetical protein